MRHPHSRYFRKTKDTRPQSDVERLKRLPEGDVSDQRRLHVRRLADGFCRSNGVPTPEVRFAPRGALRRLKGADGVCLKGEAGEAPTILLDADMGLSDTLVTCGHELAHAVRWMKGTDGGSEAECERIGREVANRYLKESRQFCGPAVVEW